jgi:hypothetical protein
MRIASVGVSPPIFSFLRSYPSLPFVIAGLSRSQNGVAKLADARRSMRKLRLHSAPTGAYARRLSMDHRVKPGGDESESGVTVGCNYSGAEARRENEISISSLPGLTRQSMLPSGMKSFWVYILASRPRGTLYVGITNNLVRRIYEHYE